MLLINTATQNRLPKILTGTTLHIMERIKKHLDDLASLVNFDGYIIQVSFNMFFLVHEPYLL